MRWRRTILVAEGELAPVDVDERVVVGGGCSKRAPGSAGCPGTAARWWRATLAPSTPCVRPAMTRTVAPSPRHSGISAAAMSRYQGSHILSLAARFEPELEAFPSRLPAARASLAVDDAAARGHPLHATEGEQTLVTGAVLVAHATLQHVGHGLETRGAGWSGKPPMVARLSGAEGVGMRKDRRCGFCVSTRTELDAKRRRWWPGPGPGVRRRAKPRHGSGGGVHIRRSLTRPAAAAPPRSFCKAAPSAGRPRAG